MVAALVILLVTPRLINELSQHLSVDPIIPVATNHQQQFPTSLFHPLSHGRILQFSSQMVWTRTYHHFQSSLLRRSIGQLKHIANPLQSQLFNLARFPQRNKSSDHRRLLLHDPLVLLNHQQIYRYLSQNRETHHSLAYQPLQLLPISHQVLVLKFHRANLLR